MFMVMVMIVQLSPLLWPEPYKEQYGVEEQIAVESILHIEVHGVGGIDVAGESHPAEKHFELVDRCQVEQPVEVFDPHHQRAIRVELQQEVEQHHLEGSGVELDRQRSFTDDLDLRKVVEDIHVNQLPLQSGQVLVDGSYLPALRLGRHSPAIPEVVVGFEQCSHVQSLLVTHSIAQKLFQFTHKCVCFVSKHSELVFNVDEHCILIWHLFGQPLVIFLHIFFLKGAKHFVPNDKDGGVVSVAGGSVVHAVVTSSVHHQFQRAELADHWGVNPELLLQVQLGVDHDLRWSEEESEPHLEHKVPWLKRGLPQGGRQILVLAWVVDHVSSPEEVLLVRVAVEQLVSKVKPENKQDPAPEWVCGDVLQLVRVTPVEAGDHENFSPFGRHLVVQAQGDWGKRVLKVEVILVSVDAKQDDGFDDQHYHHAGHHLRYQLRLRVHVSEYHLIIRIYNLK